VKTTTKTKELLGTTIIIEINSTSQTHLVENSIEEAFNFFHKVVDRFSRFNNNSELSKLNRSSGKKITVSPELFDLIKFSLELYKISNGLFDPTIITLLKAYGYDKSFDRARIAKKLGQDHVLEEIIAFNKNRPKASEIEIDPAKLEVKLQKGQGIDLGAIAKGYAIDLAKDYLNTQGYEDYIINAGGDIWAQGPKKVALYDDGHMDRRIEINNEALAGSGSFARKVGFFHHIIDPHTAKPVDHAQTVYVIAKSAMQADAFATLAFLMGQKSIKYIQNQGARIIN